jgi:hypothetical protein
LTPTEEVVCPRAPLPRRRRLRQLLVLVPLVALVMLLYAGAALTCQPAWYQPLSIDYERLEDDKRAQHRLENKISAALNENRPVEFTLEQAQLNRWIAARDELWPTEVPSIEPFSRPLVMLEDGNRLRLAALVEHWGTRVVLSTVFHVDLQERRLVVTWDSIRAGALPTPQKLLEKAAGKLAGQLDLPEHAVGDDRITLPSEGIWPNGKRPFRITGFTITSGELRVRLEPS